MCEEDVKPHVDLNYLMQKIFNERYEQLNSFASTHSAPPPAPSILM